MLEQATKPILKLSIISTLFEVLHENSILYCHWKSNEHLGASMQGLTDLDVLFAEDQKEKIESILHQLGFKKFNAVRQKHYKDIVDFLIVDPDSGKVIHLHTHYRLTMGEPYLKGYQFTFDVESQTLKSRVFNEAYGLFCIQPAFELVLLFCRESLKLRHRDIFRLILRNKLYNSEYRLREYYWLKARTTDEEIREVVKTFFGNSAAIYRIVSGQFDGRPLYRLSSIIKGGSFIVPLYSPLNALLQRWFREAWIIVSRKLATVLHKPILFKRINPRGGIVVAVIGADGSGKSTITENLKNTFEGKLDVYKIYFGRGDGKASLSRKLLRACKSFFTPLVKTRLENNRQKAPPKKQGFRRILYKCIEALLVAQEKKQNLKLMKIAKRKGALVICDRYPQNKIMGYNDGPLLNDFIRSPNPILRTFAKIESKVYAQAEDYPPDILFKLLVEAEEVEQRKPGETSPDRLRMKIEAIRGLKFSPETKVVMVDAARPLNEVLCFIRKETWKAL